MYSESQKKATIKYIKENRERLNLMLPKGKKEEYQAFAKSKGKSLTQYWVDYIEGEIAIFNNQKERRGQCTTKKSVNHK